MLQISIYCFTNQTIFFSTELFPMFVFLACAAKCSSVTKKRWLQRYLKSSALCGCFPQDYVQNMRLRLRKKKKKNVQCESILTTQAHAVCSVNGKYTHNFFFFFFQKIHPFYLNIHIVICFQYLKTAVSTSVLQYIQHITLTVVMLLVASFSVFKKRTQSRFFFT